MRGLQDGLEDGAEQGTAAGEAQAIAGQGLPRTPTGIRVRGRLEEENLDLKAEPNLGRRGKGKENKEGGGVDVILMASWVMQEARDAL